MFKIGETVIHPKIGACQVKEIRELVILGGKHQCLVLIPLFENNNNLKVTLPVENSSRIGLRRPISIEKLEEVKIRLSQKVEAEAINGQEISLPVLRGKIFSGDPLKIAEVVRDLHAKIQQDGGKYASARRRTLLEKAQERLVREISLSMGVSIRETVLQIRCLLGG